MLNFTPEERKVTLFLLSLAFCGLVLSNLIKVNCRITGVVYPQIQLARLNLNKVSLTELIGAKCVPVKLAQRIIEYRNFRKEFSSLEELKEVKGIGDQRYGKLKELFFIE
ncbi:MAG: helix-hairpin-helix domain-containing protein [Candidatus Omnitrophota bacterium]|nr:helix-hairpin-helix domain-containing protein [Candidatus Omnitrophota bacterium]